MSSIFIYLLDLFSISGVWMSEGCWQRALRESSPAALLLRMWLSNVHSDSKAQRGHAERGATACHHPSRSEKQPLSVSEHCLLLSSLGGGAGPHYPTRAHRWAVMEYVSTRVVLTHILHSPCSQTLSIKFSINYFKWKKSSWVYIYIHTCYANIEQTILYYTQNMFFLFFYFKK